MYAGVTGAVSFLGRFEAALERNACIRKVTKFWLLVGSKEECAVPAEKPSLSPGCVPFGV